MTIIEADGKEKWTSRLKSNLKYKCAKIAGWCKDHPGESVTLGTAIIAGMFGLSKGIIKHVNLKQAENMKNLYCYDTSLGRYWELRRKLTNKDWLAIERRRASGEKLGEILEDLRVLK